MLTANQERIRLAFQQNPQLLRSVLQNQAVLSQLGAILGPDSVFLATILSNEAVLQQILADAENPFTINLVLSSEASFNQATTPIVEAFSRMTVNDNLNASEASERYLGLSSHSSRLETGSDRGFTLVFTSDQSFFGKNLLPRKMTAAIAETAAPADVRDLSFLS